MIKTLISFLSRDMRQAKTNRLAIFFDLATIFLVVAMCFFLSQLVSASPFLLSYGGNYFPFVLIGLAMSNFLASGLLSFSERITQEQITGTLESVLHTPIGIFPFLTGSNLWGYLYAAVEVLLFILFGVLVFGVSLGECNVLPSLVAILLTMTTFMGISVFVSALFYRYKCGNALVWFLVAACELFGGVYFPVALLPDWMQSIAAWIPMHHALEALRLSLLSHGGFSEVGPHLWYLAGFTAFLWPIGCILFTFASQKTKHDAK